MVLLNLDLLDPLSNMETKYLRFVGTESCWQLGKSEPEYLKQFEFCMSSRTILAAFERTNASYS